MAWPVSVYMYSTCGGVGGQLSGQTLAVIFDNCVCVCVCVCVRSIKIDNHEHKWNFGTKFTVNASL